MPFWVESVDTLPAPLTHPSSLWYIFLIDRSHSSTAIVSLTSTTELTISLVGKSLSRRSTAWSMLSPKMSQIAIVAPRSTRYLAVANPMPLAAPVMVMILPENEGGGVGISVRERLAEEDIEKMNWH
jgi:hypothetical protein